MSDDSDKYEVGYKRPPKHSQFKAGSSGNPKGRPTGSKNLRTVVNDTLNEKIQITQNGRTSTATIMEAILKRVANKALNGDMRAADLLFKKWVTYFPDLADPKDPPKLELIQTVKCECGKTIKSENSVDKNEADNSIP